MKLILDLDQSPIALKDELTKAVRLALGTNFYIEESDGAKMFTVAEVANPAINMASVSAPSTIAALPALTPETPIPASSLPASSGVELDSEGHPHDIRIHSSGKSKIAAGTWKLKKGVDPQLVIQVNAQNKALVGAQLPTALPTASNVVQLPTLPTLAALPELPPVAPVAAADVEIVVTDYPTFAAYVAQQLVIKPTAAKRELDKGLTHYGFVDAAGNPDLTALQHRADAVIPLYQWFKAVVNLSEEG